MTNSKTIKVQNMTDAISRSKTPVKNPVTLRTQDTGKAMIDIELNAGMAHAILKCMIESTDELISTSRDISKGEMNVDYLSDLISESANKLGDLAGACNVLLDAIEDSCATVRG